LLFIFKYREGVQRERLRDEVQEKGTVSCGGVGGKLTGEKIFKRRGKAFS
jgi:hypothetical protein